jgi:hypothetical protein
MMTRDFSLVPLCSSRRLIATVSAWLTRMAGAIHSLARQAGDYSDALNVHPGEYNHANGGLIHVTLRDRGPLQDQTRSSDDVRRTIALPLEADLTGSRRHVSQVPKAAVSRCSIECTRVEFYSITSSARADRLGSTLECTPWSGQLGDLRIG